MTIEQLATWATIIGSLISFMALAWSAVTYVGIRKQEIKHLEYQKFFEICDHLGHQGGSISSKMAAAFELRKYPQYREMIVRLVDKVQIDGDSAQMLKDELELTSKFLAGK